MVCSGGNWWFWKVCSSPRVLVTGLLHSRPDGEWPSITAPGWGALWSSLNWNGLSWPFWGAELRYQLWHQLLWLWGPVRVSSYGMVGQDTRCVGAKEPLTEGPCFLVTLCGWDLAGIISLLTYHLSNFDSWLYAIRCKTTTTKTKNKKTTLLCKTQTTQKIAWLIGRINWLGRYEQLLYILLLGYWTKKNLAFCERAHRVKASLRKISLLTTSPRRRMVCYAHFTAAGTEAPSSFNGLVRIRVRLVTQLNKRPVPPIHIPTPTEVWLCCFNSLIEILAQMENKKKNHHALLLPGARVWYLSLPSGVASQKTCSCNWYITKTLRVKFL